MGDDCPRVSSKTARLARGVVQLFDSSDDDTTQARTTATAKAAKAAAAAQTITVKQSCVVPSHVADRTEVCLTTVSPLPGTSTHTEKSHSVSAETHRGSVTDAKKPLEDSEDDEADLDAQLAAAAARELRRNPHAERGRARPVQNRYTVKKVDLFNDDDSEDANGDEESASRNVSSGLTAEEAARAVSGSTRSALRSDSVQHETKGTALSTSACNARDELMINKNYAAKYDEVKRRKELQQLTHKYGAKLGNTRGLLEHSGSSSSEEETENEDEEDDDAVLLTEDNELAFARALVAVRRAAVSAVTQSHTGPARTHCSEQSKIGTHNGNRDKDSSAAAAAAASRTNTDEDRQEDNEDDAERVFRQARFFPDVDEQVRRNTEVFASAVRQRRAAKQHKFTLADEYRRALLTQTEQSTQDTVDEEGVRQDGAGIGRRLKPQSAAEREAKRAFLDAAAQADDGFEMITTRRASAVSEKKASPQPNAQRSSTADDERRRLLREAFDLTRTTAKRKTKSSDTDHRAEERSDEEAKSAEESLGNEERAADGDEEVFIRDFFVHELWRPESHMAQPSDTADKRKPTPSATSPPGHTRDRNGEAKEEDGECGDVYTAGQRRYSAAQLAQEEADAIFYDDAEVWERDFQARRYRHEEIAHVNANSNGNSTAYEAVPSFARPIGEAAAGLLRASHATPTARAAARERRKQRARDEHERQVSELKRLKHLKRMEIEEQRALIATVAGFRRGSNKSHKRDGHNGKDEDKDGNADEDEAKSDEEAQRRIEQIWTDADLDAPYDPDEFAAKMKRLFNDDYYDARRVDEGEVDFMEAELDALDETGVRDTSGADAAPNRVGEHAPCSNSHTEEEVWDLLYPSSTATANMNAADTDASNSPDAIRLHGHSHSISDHSKPIRGGGSNPESAETLAELQRELRTKEDEYMRLHYEDTLDGGAVKTRFRYRTVAPEDFTLSVDDILRLDDRQLNMIAPMNCYAAYLDRASNARDAKAVARRRSHGMRLMDSERHSRRYGNVAATAVLHESITPEEGEAVARRLQKRAREVGEGEREGWNEREKDRHIRRGGSGSRATPVAPPHRGQEREWHRGRGRGGARRGRR